MPALLNILLAPISFLYKSISLLRWQQKRKHAHSFPELFIVSIDNLTFGGSGKTSMVRYMGTLLQQNRTPFAVVSRGYKSQIKKGCREILPTDEASLAGDEALLLKRQFPQAPVLIGPDRLAALESLSQGPRRVVLLDDGFQSAHIRKDLSILLHTPQHPAYYHRNFAFMARYCDLELTLQPSKAAFPTHPPAKPCYRFRHLGLFNGSGQKVDVGTQTLVAFSGLGDNRRFFQDLSRYKLKAVLPYPDHHVFSPADIRHIRASIQRHQAAFGVCTLKDFVKLPQEVQTDPTFLYAENTIELNFDLLSYLLTIEKFCENIEPSS